MTLEYNFRVEQIQALTKKLYMAPFSHQEASNSMQSTSSHPVQYQTMWSNSKDLHAPSSTGDGAQPPHTVSIFVWPKNLGGHELMDLWVEQRVIHWGVTLRHLRRGDRAGEGMLLTLNDHQCVVGSSTNFLHLDPNKYDYADKHTRWYYSWKMMWDLQLKTYPYDPWVPKSVYHNDNNIMDVAANDRFLMNSKWPLLYHVNCCRIYLQAFIYQRHIPWWPQSPQRLLRWHNSKASSIHSLL